MSVNESQFSFLFTGRPLTAPLSGRELMESGMASVISHTPEEWKVAFTNAILSREIGSTFTMEEIREQVGDPPMEVHPNAVGAITYHLARKGMIKKTGVVVKTHRPERRNSDAPCWVRTRETE